MYQQNSLWFIYSNRRTRRRCDLLLRDVPSEVADFLDRHFAIVRSQLSLPLRLV
jgi:hypothetical protein